MSVAAVTSTTTPKSRESPLFLSTHGWTAVLMASAFVLTGSWAVLLIAIQLAPTQVANYMMDTTELDFGDFWILARGDERIVIPTVVLLVVIAISYYGLGAVALYRELCRGGSTTRIGPASGSTQARPATVLDQRLSSAQRVRRQLAPMEESPLQSLPKLVLQIITLFSYLEEGFPIFLVLSYSSLLCCNWMIAGYCSIKRAFDTARVLVRVFYSFDLFFAVLAPLQILFFACYHFQFNRAEFATRTETLACAGFDRTARLFADPTQVSLFRIAFQSLQLTSWSALVIRGGLSILTIRRWWRVVSITGNPATPSDRPGDAPSSTVSTSSRTLCRGRISNRNHLIGTAFFTLGFFFTSFSVISVVSTRRSCKPFKQCQVARYAVSKQCGCVVFVDQETRVPTFTEWENPVDTTPHLEVLAATGSLRIVQIVNRQLPTLPIELRRCHQLEQLVLLYTKTTVVPEWVGEFSELKYLCVSSVMMPADVHPTDWSLMPYAH